MSKNISPKDWQNLSAYLDDQLTTREHIRLETRLAQEPNLQQALREIRQTRLLLRQTRKIHVPRHFTITPEMAAQIRPVRKTFMLPFLSYSSIAAAILMIFVLVVDLLPGYLNKSSSRQAENLTYAVQAPMMESMLDEEPPMIIQWDDQAAYGKGGSGGGDNSSFAAADGLAPIGGGTEVDPSLTTAPEEPLPDGGALLPGPAAKGAGEETPTPEVTVSIQEVVPSMSTPEPLLPTPQPLSGTGPILGIVSDDEAQIYNQSVLDILAEQSQQPILQTQSEPYPWLRGLQIGLGAFALISGISAFILWRRTRI
jgi:hypothetical protein